MIALIVLYGSNQLWIAHDVIFSTYHLFVELILLILNTIKQQVYCMLWRHYNDTVSKSVKVSIQSQRLVSGQHFEVTLHVNICSLPLMIKGKIEDLVNL